MKFEIGQYVKFATRNGKPEGISGKGTIVEVHRDITNKYIVAETYTVQNGPYKGQEVTRRVMCLEFLEVCGGCDGTVECE